MKRVRLEYFDQNDAFANCLPRTGRIAGRFAAATGEDNWHLIELEEPITYQLKGGEPLQLQLIETRHLLIRSRWVGQEIGEPRETSVFVLLVDPSQLPLSSPLSIEQYHHVAWGMCYTLRGAA
jgi:hypothetical protein